MNGELVGVVVVEESAPSAETGRPGPVAALEHVANRPIAHHVLDVLESAGAREVVVACSTGLGGTVRECLADRGTSDGAELRYVEQDRPVGVARAIGMAAGIVDRRPCIVHLASGLLGDSLNAFSGPLRGRCADLSLIVHQGAGGCARRLSSETQELLHVAELDPRRASLNQAGVWMFGPGALAHASEAVAGADGEVDFADVARRLRGVGGSIQIHRAENWCEYSGDSYDLLELNRLALDRLDCDTPFVDDAESRIEGRVRLERGAEVRSSVIIGPAIIGPGAHIEHAYIGPYTSVGPGARIEGAEIERSIISAGVTISYIRGRLASSVIGREAKIFRDFSLPRALRLRVGDGTEVALC